MFTKDIVNQFGKYLIQNTYYLLTGCEGSTRKHKPEVFHIARACEGCMEKAIAYTYHKSMARTPS